jgi:hypothetical protein
MIARQLTWLSGCCDVIADSFVDLAARLGC